MPSSTPRKKKPMPARTHPLHDKGVFNEMMAAYRREVLASPEAAREALLRIGIITKSGKLSKNYK